MQITTEIIIVFILGVIAGGTLGILAISVFDDRYDMEQIVRVEPAVLDNLRSICELYELSLVINQFGITISKYDELTKRKFTHTIYYRELREEGFSVRQIVRDKISEWEEIYE